MRIKGKDLRGSGSKENVGRKPRPYPVKAINKEVPIEIRDLCLSLINAEILKWKLKNNY